MGDAESGREDEEDAVSLVRLAGARLQPSAEGRTEVRAHVHAAWRAGIRRRRARTVLLLAAAGLTVAALALVGRRVREEPVAERAPDEPAAVARLDTASGVVEREGPSGWVPLGVGEPLRPGSLVRTGAAGAGFRLEQGRTVRLGAESRVRWAALDRLGLEAGVVYVDSGRHGAEPSSFEVRTAWGTIRETGTQFEVRLEPASLRVRVREGRVAVLGRGPTLDVSPGAELRVGSAGASRGVVPVHGPEWSWVLALAPAFEMDGRPLHELLAWAAREAGWELRYADAESRRRAEAAQIHGSIRGLHPDDAAMAVIPSTGLAHRLHEGVLLVGPVDATDRP